MNWLLKDDNWRLLLIPPIVVILSAGFYLELTDDDPLRNRGIRTAIFDQLLGEMNGIEIPFNSAVNSTNAFHKASSILISTRYRTDADRKDFVGSMHTSLVKRGWVSCPGYHDSRTAIQTYSYCRGDQNATLYLERQAILFRNQNHGDYWTLQFSVRGGRG